MRDPGRIKSEGLATCLDSALLMAGCFEAAGLNPVVLFSEGHAWTGVWLTERDFGTISEPDVMTVRKAIDAREFVVLETTLLTKKPSVGFEQAVDTARELTSERNEHSFVMAVDIRRARAAGFARSPATAPSWRPRRKTSLQARQPCRVRWIWACCRAKRSRMRPRRRRTGSLAGNASFWISRCATGC